MVQRLSVQTSLMQGTFLLSQLLTRVAFKLDASNSFIVFAQPCEFSLIFGHTHLSLLQIMKLPSHVVQINATHIVLLELIQEELPCNSL